jgi:N-acetylglucosamine-6-phosphate deacetylase
VTLTVGGGTVIGADGALVLDGGVIAATGGDRPLDIDARGGWVVPGFIDLQINGAHGIDVTSQPTRIAELATVLPRYGVTTFLPTVITCPPAVRAAALAAWAGHGPGPGAVPLGLHMEGPMLAPVRKGAHPERHLLAPAPEVVDGWSAAAGVSLATVAPELPGALEVIAALSARGVVVSIGHTDCTAEEFTAGRAAGARYVTHLFNAMRPFDHRAPGPIGATLADDDVVAGLICDGIHVDPVAVRMAWHALGPRRLSLVTDAVAALGTDGGHVGSVRVEVTDGAVRNAAGVLAGSVLSLDQAVRNLVAFTGCAVPDAIATVTSTPADLLGLTDRGRLAVGARADVTVLDAELRVVATIVGGEVAWRS